MGASHHHAICYAIYDDVYYICYEDGHMGMLLSLLLILPLYAQLEFFFTWLILLFSEPVWSPLVFTPFLSSLPIDTLLHIFRVLGFSKNIDG